MRYLLDAIYVILGLVVAPILIVRSLKSGKYRRGIRSRLRLGSTITIPPKAGRSRIWFHGVSVGEIHLMRHVVGAFRLQNPDHDCVISATTDTGFDEATKWFPDLVVVRFPLDMSWAVANALRAIEPDRIVLAESELWPNFLLAARRNRIPVTVINARMSPRSFRRWQWVRPVARRLFGLVDHFAVQTAEYANHLQHIGVAQHRLTVTGSVKYDGAAFDRGNSRTVAMGELLAVRSNDVVWIAGSTQTPEEDIVLSVFQIVRRQYPQLRLILVPRQKERFDEVANQLEQAGIPFVRRSMLNGPVHDREMLVLVDTIGELSAIWGLADIAFVGGSLDGHRGGQNMIEPAAYGAAVLFGPHVWNFRETAERLLAADAALQIRDASDLQQNVERLLAETDERHSLGRAAREFVQQQKGATDRTIRLLSPTPPVAKAG